MSDGRVEFEITADGRKAFASIDQVTDALQKAGKGWEKDAGKSTDNITGSFEGMVKKIVGTISAAKIGQMLLNIGKDAIQAASDLEEVQNVVDVTFGDAGAVKIEKWAQTAGKQFGLTETQAKKFTSTLGAMMKSAGMTGDEIVTMSTDLSGLAADIASFYNLDFDTAFQKIRSGISGETEPLKQLGINMSEVNLQAFAMAQGIETAYSEMSQGEKTLLRYQYLMQATADAQGDFARTSDGFANGVRQIETNLETLKTNLGKTLLPVVNDVVAGINSIFEAFTKKPESTVLDDFAAIDLKTAEKIAGVEATAEKARSLTNVLDKISEKADKNKQKIGAMDDEAPDGSALDNLVGALKGIDGQAGTDKDSIAAIDSNAPDGKTGKLKGLSESLAAIGTKAGDNKNAIGAMDDDAPDGSKLTKITKSVEEVGNKAGKGHTAIKEMTNDAPDGSDLKELTDKVIDVGKEADNSNTKVISILDGVETDTKDGKLKTLAENILNVGTEATESKAAVEEMIEPTTEVVEQDALWLATCEELVKTLPGLSSIINTQTGEIEGGTDAVRAYIDEWERGQKYLAVRSAYDQKQAALDAKQEELIQYELNYIMAAGKAKKLQEQLRNQFGAEFTGLDLSTAPVTAQVDDFGNVTNQDEVNNWNRAFAEYDGLVQQAKQLKASWDEQRTAYNEAVTDYEAGLELIKEEYGQVSDAVDEWTEEQKQAASEAVTGFGEALTAVEEYYKTVREETAKQVGNNISGFKDVKTVSEQYEEIEKAMKEVKDGKDELAELKKFFGEDIVIRVDTKGAQKTLNDMVTGLKDQLEFMQQYEKDLNTAREKGLSEQMLSFLSDGSEQSAAYVNAIAQADKKDIEEINKLYAEVTKGKESFVDTLTKQKLEVDEQYSGLVESAKQAAKDLDVSKETQKAAADNIQGIILGIRKNVPTVASEVDAVLAQLNRLNDWGVNIDYGFGKSTVIKPKAVTNGAKAIPGLAVGMDWVPFDGFLASLHEGEAVLTAEENRVWQQFKNNQRGVDYDQLGGVMRESIRPGGDVYLDGRVVGQVVSQIQGNQYRSLQRSGWQQ